MIIEKVDKIVIGTTEFGPVKEFTEILGEKGYCTIDDLLGNGDRLHGYMFSSQKEADDFVDAYRELFPDSMRVRDYKKLF